MKGPSSASRWWAGGTIFELSARRRQAHRGGGVLPAGRLHVSDSLYVMDPSMVDSFREGDASYMQRRVSEFLSLSEGLTVLSSVTRSSVSDRAFSFLWFDPLGS